LSADWLGCSFQWSGYLMGGGSGDEGQQLAERGLSSFQIPGKHTSRAKARSHSIGAFAGDESPAYHPDKFFRSLPGGAMGAWSVC
jgi:hypothetical protein